jgi:thiamine biosynthesis lipoprotein
VHGVEVLIAVETSRSWEVRHFRAMGASGHLLLGDAPAGLVAWAGQEIERLEQTWTRFREDSDLQRLNGRAGQGHVAVSPLLALALRCASELAHATEGRFDPTIADALTAAGYDRSFGDLDLDVPQPPAPPRPAPGRGGYEVDPATSTARLAAGVHLDLGGLGKGLAADLVVEGLLDRGAASVCLSLGGDIRVGGEPDEPGGWRLAVEDPFDDGRDLVEVVLDQGALVTSTRLLRRWRRAGREQHHIIDPRTGRPAWTGLAAVAVQGPTAWWSEGLAKAALVAGPREGAALLAGAGLRAWMVHDDRTVTTVGTPRQEDGA